jgi:hypothetical protein
MSALAAERFPLRSFPDLANSYWASIHFQGFAGGQAIGCVIHHLVRA